jgi:hypothetical protein
MKTKNKLGLNDSFIASMEIMRDRYDYEYWERSIGFIKEVRDLDYSLLTKNQRNWIISIKNKLQNEGLVK